MGYSRFVVVKYGCLSKRMSGIMESALYLFKEDRSARHIINVSLRRLPLAHHSSRLALSTQIVSQLNPLELSNVYRAPSCQGAHVVSTSQSHPPKLVWRHGLGMYCDVLRGTRPSTLRNWGVQCVYTGFRDTVPHPADRCQCLLQLSNAQL